MLNANSFAQFTFLQVLTLSDNHLDDLENVYDELRPLHHLTVLELFDNPVAQEDNYRLRTIGELPSVKVLDRHEVTHEERREALVLLMKLARLKNFNLTTKGVVPPKYTLQEKAERERVLMLAMRRLTLMLSAKRVALEPLFLVLDKRRLGEGERMGGWRDYPRVIDVWVYIYVCVVDGCV
jgi:hypothetical protein